MENWSPVIDPTFRKGQCEFHTWDWAIDPVFHEDTLQLQNSDAKASLFKEYLPTHREQIKNGEKILQRLRDIHPVAASLFSTKPYLLDAMTLRLINGETTDAAESYSALSYCWPENAVSSPVPGKRYVPISPLLYQHFILQRWTADEGVWCDQLCIDQTNKEEKHATITAMDALYSCARVVIVALEDIEISIDEERFLQAFIEDYEDESRPPLPPPHIHENPPFMERNPNLKDFFVKICESRWFQRAWCSHEMRLAKRHRFLIRCASSSQRLLSFSDFFLAYLIMLSAKCFLPGDGKAVRHMLERVFNYGRYMDNLRQILRKAPREPISDETKIEAYTTSIAEIFTLHAGGDPEAANREKDANIDRMTIVLNTMENGLSVKRFAAAQSPRLDGADNCQALLLLISLAAGDPTSLCTNGQPFKLNDAARNSWLRIPNYTDIGSGAMRSESLPVMCQFDIKLDTSPGLAWIETQFFVSDKPRKPSEELASVASLVVNAARNAGLGGGFLGQLAQGPAYLGWRMEADFDYWNENFVGIIAAMLEFGPEWVLGMVGKCGFSSPSMLGEMKDIMREYLTGDHFDIEWLRGLEWTKSKATLDAVNCLMRFAYWMVAWSMSIMPQTHPDRWTWKPFICFENMSFKALIIAPEGTVPAIPLPLLRPGYDRLPRVWLLEPDEQKHDDGYHSFGDSPTLFGKSILFADLSAEQYSEGKADGSCKDLRVFGPKETKPAEEDSGV